MSFNYLLEATDADTIEQEYAQAKIMIKRRKLLAEHSSQYWYSEGQKCWYCYLPDEEKGRKRYKRKEKGDIEAIIVDYYSTQAANFEDTLEGLFQQYIGYKKTTVELATVRRICYDWKRFYEGTDFVKKPYRDIKKPDVDVFLNEMLRKHKIKDKAFKNAAGVLKQTFEYAVDMDYIDTSPYRTSRVNKKELVPSVKKNNSFEIFFSEEQAALFNVLENMNDGPIPLGIMLDFETGLRKGELLALRKSNVDFENDDLYVEEQVVEDFDPETMQSLGFEAANYTKTPRSIRKVILSEKAKELLKKLMSYSSSDYIFMNGDKLYTPDAVDYCLKKACRLANIPQKSMHKIRKTYASRLLSNGIDISVVSRMLGHADETTTYKHYIFNTHHEDSTKKKVQDVLNH